ncbi:phage major capsid protein [Mesorhizobium sp. CO1-1-9]|uniref:phage major capsid protein n=1 Tax=Mesorhizobium sp. CO1-1-9 TaxID=2876630 RepID=UPI001CCD2A5A|nr:phage major capsid protein [Mesorhizobium sp. CO1-1-9]MBZ9694548.1 phage major capsid protein [Mesorhizobium sp. CO1-1-9]
MDKLEIKANFSVSDAGEITGIAWPFGSPDSVGDIIHKGAFTRAAAMPILFEHDPNRVVGNWESVEETDEGLQVKGRLFLDGVPRAREVHTSLKRGRVNGLSIGFRATETKTRPDGNRTILALNLAEISIVANPSHPDARILTVKSADGAAQTIGNDMPNENTAPAPEYAELEKKVAAVADEVKTVAKLTERFDKLEAKLNRPAAANSNVPTAGNDNSEVKAFSTFVRNGDANEVKSLGYATPSTGGILAPESVSTSILEKVAEFSPVRSLAQTISMSGPLLQLPRLVDEVTVGEVAETAARPESEPTFDQIDLKAFEMAVIVPVTRILLEDAQIDLAAYLGGHIARRFGQKEAGWFVKGNGTSQAEGVLTSTDVAEVEADIAADDLIDLFYSIKTTYSSNGSWLMNRKTMAVVRKLKDTDGSYIWQPALTAGQPPLLLGRPVYEGVDMPDPVAGNKAIVFGDFATGYAIADRVGFEIIRDDLTGAANGIVKLHARRRVGGRVVMGEALTKLKVAA